jgi:hypothetical protein
LYLPTVELAAVIGQYKFPREHLRLHGFRSVDACRLSVLPVFGIAQQAAVVLLATGTAIYSPSPWNESLVSSVMPFMARQRNLESSGDHAASAMLAPNYPDRTARAVRPNPEILT